MSGDYPTPNVRLVFAKNQGWLESMKELEKYTYTMNLLGIPWDSRTRDTTIPRASINGYEVAGMDNVKKELDSSIRLYAKNMEAHKPKLEMYLNPEDKKIRKLLESQFYAMDVLKIPCKMVDNNWDGDDFPELKNNGYIVGGLGDIEHSLKETMKYYVDSSKKNQKIEA